MKVQNWLKTNNIDIFLVNRTDEFLNEYIASYAERLKWISNFSGSAGRAIIYQYRAIIFVDGRYTIQVQDEVDKNLFKIEKLNNYWKFLQDNISSNNLIGVDSSLHSVSEIKKLLSIINKKKSKIEYLKKNPIDLCWKNQPKYPKSKAFFLNEKYSGISASKKINKIKGFLKINSIDYYLITSLDSIAWLLNIRANDILYTPLLFSYLLITKKGKIEFFVEKNKIKNIERKLNKIVNIKSFNKIENFLDSLKSKSVIGIDIDRTNYKFKKIFESNKLIVKIISDPCVEYKAKKNKIEIKGAKEANMRDAVSVTKFLYWIKNEMNIFKTNEILASKYLLNLRKKNKLFFSLSFETISAFGKNSAIPHYRLSKKTNMKFSKNNIFLIDSGAQYYDGTTDLTRTVIIGKATKEQKDRFTRVLKGHIAIAKVIFKENTRGSTLDHLARKSLKDINCDYDHGTGHGIGSFLCVHEGPQRIAKKNNFSKDAKLKKGMILSNEPGFYKKDKYGIRIENLIAIIKNGKNLEFETITFVPIDLELINNKLLNKNEKDWLNKYHRKVFLKLKKYMNRSQLLWLKKITKPI